MTDWSKILNWKLLNGSHKFPGPDGGTCINEAAIVAAGFEYRSVGGVDDLPPCFCRVVSRYALALNDHMSDDVRQRLIPFVTRLAGTAGGADVARERAQFIALETVRRVVPPALEAAGLEAEADACRNATDLEVAQAEAGAATARAAGAAWLAADAADAAGAAWLAADAADAADADAAGAAARAAWLAADADAAGAATANAAIAAAMWAVNAVVETEAWDIALDILDGALAIGPKAEPIEIALVQERMEEAKAKVREAS